MKHHCAEMRSVDKHRQFSVSWLISSHGHWANKGLMSERSMWTFICSATVHIAVWIWYTPACRKAGFGIQKVGDNQSVQRSKKHQRRPFTWRQRKCSMWGLYIVGGVKGEAGNSCGIRWMIKWWLRQEKLCSEGCRTGEKGKSKPKENIRFHTFPSTFEVLLEILFPQGVMAPDTLFWWTWQSQM